MTQGTRFPTLAFVTGGAGEANDGIPPQPFETFCYDAALLQAKIHNFNIVTYTSVLPKELYGNIVAVDKVAGKFHHGAVLEVIMSAAGAKLSDHRSIVTGLGICWGKDKKGRLIGGWAAEYVERFETAIDDEIAKMHARMWLTKSLNHELSLRGVDKHSEFQYWHNYLNLTQPFGYCLTAMGFLNFEHADPVKLEDDPKETHV
jgi:arginine decarboxylase